MARIRKPKQWTIRDVDYRSRYTLYRILAAVGGGDRNKSKVRAEALEAVRGEDDELYPAVGMTPAFVDRIVEIVRATAGDEGVLRTLGDSLKAKAEDQPSVALEVSLTDADTILSMYDEYIKDPSGAPEFSKMANLQRVTWIVEALESAKAGVAIPGVIEPVPESPRKATPAPEPAPSATS